MNKLIIITGGSASGKTTVAESIKEILGNKAVLISQDNFYKEKGSPQTNYDQPGAFDFDLQDKVISALLKDKKTTIPIYDFTLHKRIDNIEIEPKEYIILEGLFTFQSNLLNSNSLFKIFVDTPSDTRLARRVLRDFNTRGRKLEDILERWIRDVQPSYKKYIAKYKKAADIIIPWSAINKKSIKVVISALQHHDK